MERTYIIPLRREYNKIQRYKRAKKGITGIRDFIARHMKAESKDVKLGIELNHYIWQHGIRNPPVRVKVTSNKDDKGVVFVNLFGIKPKEETKKKGVLKKAVKKEEPAEFKKETPVAAEPKESSKPKT